MYPTTDVESLAAYRRSWQRRRKPNEVSTPLVHRRKQTDQVIL